MRSGDKVRVTKGRFKNQEGYIDRIVVYDTNWPVKVYFIGLGTRAFAESELELM